MFSPLNTHAHTFELFDLLLRALYHFFFFFNTATGDQRAVMYLSSLLMKSLSIKVSTERAAGSQKRLRFQ